MSAQAALWTTEELNGQQRMPEALRITGHVCPRCGTPVLAGERDAEGRWRCRGCRTYQTEPRVVPVLSR